jgi:hypothetical protein
MRPKVLSPNIGLLKDAYAIIDGIPDGVFDLHQIARQNAQLHHKNLNLYCGTIACAAGWLALHPTFAASVRTVKTNYRGRIREIVWHDRQGNEFISYGNHDWAQGMAELFSLALRDTYTLFGARLNVTARYDEAILAENERITDKQLWQARVRKFIANHEDNKY